LFYPENWGVDFRGTLFTLGNGMVYPPIPGGVTVPPDFVSSGPRGGAFYPPQRLFFTVSISYGDPVPSFYGESEFGPVTRIAADRKALLQGPDWTDYNASFAETEGFNT
jgi:hypothetical protein